MKKNCVTLKFSLKNENHPHPLGTGFKQGESDIGKHRHIHKKNSICLSWSNKIYLFTQRTLSTHIHMLSKVSFIEIFPMLMEMSSLIFCSDRKILKKRSPLYFTVSI